MKKINIPNLVPEHLEAEPGEHPWGDLIYDDNCLVSTYAAQAALMDLARAWTEDFGQDRLFVLSTLDRTIALLERWREAFAAVVVTEDMIDSATERLATIMAERRLTANDLTVVTHTLDSASRARGKSCFTEAEMHALVTAAFAAKEEA